MKKQSPYEQRVSVQSKQLDDATIDNPYCAACGWRTFPLWGPHTCPTESTRQESAYIRHQAGHILSNLMFSRIPPWDMVSILGVAFSFALGNNMTPDRVMDQWDATIDPLTDLISINKERQYQNPVAHLTRPVTVRKPAKKSTKKPVTKTKPTKRKI